MSISDPADFHWPTSWLVSCRTSSLQSRASCLRRRRRSSSKDCTRPTGWYRAPPSKPDEDVWGGNWPRGKKKKTQPTKRSESPHPTQQNVFFFLARNQTKSKSNNIARVIASIPSQIPFYTLVYSAVLRGCRHGENVLSLTLHLTFTSCCHQENQGNFFVCTITQLPLILGQCFKEGNGWSCVAHLSSVCPVVP